MTRIFEFRVPKNLDITILHVRFACTCCMFGSDAFATVVVCASRKQDSLKIIAIKKFLARSHVLLKWLPTEFKICMVAEHTGSK